MRPIIRKLPEELINIISAGEVVERPASVVKELVENSIDANSKNIKVELLEGGIKKIIVTDDGIGMKKEELPLALTPHATSKIQTADDIFNIYTLGFRGEAIPSIAGVSKFKICSRTSEENYGYYLALSNGKVESEGSVPMNVGTKVEVEDLFFNTPARYKHLSSAYTESSYIIDYLYKSALANPLISFSLINNNKLIYQTHGSNDLVEIISETYGDQVAKNLLAFENSNSMYHISGYTTKNQVFRSNKNGLTIFVNGRIIKNTNLIYAIIDAYKSIIPIGKYPITILKIVCDPSIIDVNVHPSKLEIRLTDEYALRQLITKTLLDTLTKSALIYENIYYEKAPFKEVEEKIAEEVKTEATLDELWDNFETVDTTSKSSIISSLIKEELNNNKVLKEDNFLEEKLLEDRNILNKKETLPDSRKFFESLQYIGQFHKTYLLFEKDDELYLIDQHAAAERINYEKIQKSFNDLTLNEASYELLVPIHLNFNVAEIPTIEALLPRLEKLKIKMEHFGGATYKVTTVPVWFQKGKELEAILDLIELLKQYKSATPDVLYDEVAKSMSCKKSLKANMFILKEEVAELLKELDLAKMPFTCPHGRPTLIKFSTYELEKLFKRVL